MKLLSMSARPEILYYVPSLWPVLGTKAQFICIDVPIHSFCFYETPLKAIHFMIGANEPMKDEFNILPEH